jgi:hypothetical protein
MKQISQIHIVHRETFVEVTVWSFYTGLAPACERLTFKSLVLALRALQEKAS